MPPSSMDIDTTWGATVTDGMQNYRVPFGLGVAFWASLGVRSVYEVTTALVAQLLYWFLGFHGPEPLYSMLAGIQFGRQQYRHALPATILDGYYTIDGFNGKGLLHSQSLFVSGVWVVGFLLGKYRSFK